jgi:cyclopropane-fatty-acyl-phospholipid synthase
MTDDRAPAPSVLNMAGDTTGADLGGLWSAFLHRCCAQLELGEVSIRFPNGTTRHYRGQSSGPKVALDIKTWAALRRMAFGGELGFAEAYLSGEIGVDDVDALLRLASLNQHVLDKKFAGFGVMRVVNRLAHLLRPNTRKGSRRNIAAHYDLGNDFYRLWLDESMTYSAARFADEGEDLAAAQSRKYRRIAELAGIGPGSRVLEVGCGWGGFAEMAARDLDCRPVSLTISDAQYRFARERIARAGLADKADIRLQDYRDSTGQYDAVVSIEMFEAVGERHWPVYFQVLRDRMATGAKAALQIITISEDRYASYRKSADFIQRYIFPGGMLPTRQILETLAQRAGLSVLSNDGFGGDYARTLRLWGERFRENWPAIQSLGFDDRFRRMWDYYLRYCEVGFSLGKIDVVHLQLERRS